MRDEREEKLMEAFQEYITSNDKEVKKCIVKLANFKLDGCPKALLDSPYYEKGDEDAPFFTEAFLYPLLGKEDARSVLAFVNNLLRALGYKHGLHDVPKVDIYRDPEYRW